MSIEISERKMKRRRKVDEWRKRTGKSKPMKGDVFFNGRLAGFASRVYLSKTVGAV